jgi:threonine dehydratase
MYLKIRVAFYEPAGTKTAGLKEYAKRNNLTGKKRYGHCCFGANMNFDRFIAFIADEAAHENDRPTTNGIESR